MNRSLIVLFSACALFGAGCNVPKLSVEEAVEQAKETVQNAVQNAAEEGAEEVVKQRTGQNVDLDVTNSGATFIDPKTGKTISVGANITIPDTFPKDIPLYPGATPTSLSMDAGSASLLLISKESRTAIRDWYQEQAAATGWAEEGVLETADQVIVSFQKDDAKWTVTLLPPNLQNETGVLLLRKGE